MSRPPVTAEFIGGPAHGKVERFVPMPGQSIECLRFAVPPAVEWETATEPDPGPVVAPVAEYVLVHATWLNLGEADAFARNIPAGRHLVHGFYEYRGTR